MTISPTLQYSSTEIMYLLGIDLGSSSIKVSLLNADAGKVIASYVAPGAEMEIVSSEKGWAEQDPEIWWSNTIIATLAVLKESKIDPKDIKAIGIAYQMHGLVVVDSNRKVLRSGIIWCDSRAVNIGNEAYQQLGEMYCMNRLLNSPGNFTASKLKWVKENEPNVYSKIHKMMLPGDFLAMKMTDEIKTTTSGLSEGMLWDYENDCPPERLLKFYGIDQNLLPEIVGTFSEQGKLTKQAAALLGLVPETPITYRAGDQPNNAFSLKALNPGEIAATAGTSGVIYGIVDTPTSDRLSRVNTFIHVNDSKVDHRFGVLLCVNGTGIMNSWLRKSISNNDNMLSYEEMNLLASNAPIGSDGVSVLPFGNGAERMFENEDLGASFHGLNLTRHNNSHLCRAVQEGIVFSLAYGFEILNSMGIEAKTIRAGQANMFLSDVFCEAFCNVTGATIELVNTDGAQGAARAAGVGLGYYKNMEDAFHGQACLKKYSPNAALQKDYKKAYSAWKTVLEKQLKN